MQENTVKQDFIFNIRFMRIEGEYLNLIWYSIFSTRDCDLDPYSFILNIIQHHQISDLCQMHPIFYECFIVNKKDEAWNILLYHVEKSEQIEFCFLFVSTSSCYSQIDPWPECNQAEQKPTITNQPTSILYQLFNILNQSVFVYTFLVNKANILFLQTQHHLQDCNLKLLS